MLVALGCFVTQGQAEAGLSALDVSSGAEASNWAEATYVSNQVLASTDSYVMSAAEQKDLANEANEEAMYISDANKHMYVNTLGNMKSTVLPTPVSLIEGQATARSTANSQVRVRSRANGFFDNIVSKVKSTVDKVGTGIKNFVGKIQDGINTVREKVSNWVGNAVAKAQEWGASLGGKIGDKISEIAGNIGKKYNDLNNQVKTNTDALTKRVQDGVDGIGNKINIGLDAVSKWLNNTFANRELIFQTTQHNKMAIFQGQQWMNIKFLHNQLGMTQDKLLGYIKQLRDQAGGFRESGSLPKSMVVVTKDGKQVVVGSVQGGVTPLAQYTGAPQGAGIYVAKDGTAYTSGGVILPRHSGRNGPQAYVGPNGLVYNAGPYPSPFFYGSTLPTRPSTTGNMARFSDIFGKGGVGALFKGKKKTAAATAKSNISKGPLVPRETTRRPNKKDQEYPDLDVNGRPVGEGWVESRDDNGKPIWTRETVFKDSKTSSTSTSSGSTINSSTKNVLGGHYNYVKGTYDAKLVSGLFGGAEGSHSDILKKHRRDDGITVTKAARRGAMANDRYH